MEVICIIMLNQIIIIKYIEKIYNNINVIEEFTSKFDDVNRCKYEFMK